MKGNGGATAKTAVMRRVLLVLAMAMAVAPAPADADPRSRAEPFAAGAGDVLPLCVDGLEPSRGGACFDVGDVTEPIVEVEGDNLGDGFQYRFVTDRPRVLASGSFCGRSELLWVPPGASRLLVGRAYATGPCVRLEPRLEGELQATYYDVPGAMGVTSDAFEDRARIPARFSCDAGSSPSPALSWTGVPDGTRELALVVEDPDTPVGTFVHWVVYGIDPSATGLAEGELPEGAVVGSSSWRGPCPPPGDPDHRYIFTLYAIDRVLDLPPGRTPAQLRSAIGPFGLLDQARLTGLYSRP